MGPLAPAAVNARLVLEHPAHDSGLPARRRAKFDHGHRAAAEMPDALRRGAPLRAGYEEVAPLSEKRP